MLVGFPSKAATAICSFAYSPGPGAEPLVFEGRTEGTIVPARGDKVFGSVAYPSSTLLFLSFASLCSETLLLAFSPAPTPDQERSQA